jgi:hypothetical protein
MMAKVALLLDRSAAMTVRTPDLTLGDLALDRSDRVLLVGKLDNGIAFRPDMIEVQDDWIAFPAVHTGCSFQVIDDEQQVPPTQGAALSHSPPVGVDPPWPCPQGGASAMAVGADKLAVCDLLDDAAQAVALSHQTSNFGALRSNMVELEYKWIRQAAVGTPAGPEQVSNKLPRGGSPFVASGSRLAPVQFASVTDVVATTVLAPSLLAVKTR